MVTRILLPIIAVLVLAPMNVVATDPYYVYREIDLFGNAVESAYCWEDSHNTCQGSVAGLPAQKMFRSTASQFRLPQFWDETPFEVNFKVKTFEVGTIICNPSFPAELPGALWISIQDPDLGSTVASGEITFVAELNTAIDVTGTFSDVQSLVAGKLYAVTVNVYETENLVNCERWAVGGMNLKFPVVLPFIFENGFEEGQAAFWSELHGY